MSKKSELYERVIELEREVSRLRAENMRLQIELNKECNQIVPSPSVHPVHPPQPFPQPHNPFWWKPSTISVGSKVYENVRVS